MCIVFHGCFVKRWEPPIDQDSAAPADQISYTTLKQAFRDSVVVWVFGSLICIRCTCHHNQSNTHTHIIQHPSSSTEQKSVHIWLCGGGSGRALSPKHSAELRVCFARDHFNRLTTNDDGQRARTLLYYSCDNRELLRLLGASFLSSSSHLVRLVLFFARETSI